MKAKSFLLILVLLLNSAFAGEDKEKSAPFNFAELILKSERIVLGEIGEKKDGAVTVKAIETLKSPPRDPKQFSPDAFKRAQELLAGGKSDLPPLPKDSAAIENVNIAVIPPQDNMLPAQGTQVLFFLWEPEKREEGIALTYKINHRQNVYDAKVLPQVRVALALPRSIADGRYLRDSDERAAARAVQRKADDAMKINPGGEPVLGLQIEVLRPHLMLRGDNSLQMTVHLNNMFGKEMALYDGPARAYGLIIRAKGAAPETAQVLHLFPDGDVDATSLEIITITDFDSISGLGMLPRELLFDAAKIPALKTFSGDCLIKVFYTNKRTGAKDGLTAPAWTGTVVSKEVPFTFKKVEEKATRAEK